MSLAILPADDIADGLLQVEEGMGSISASKIKHRRAPIWGYHLLSVQCFHWVFFSP